MCVPCLLKESNVFGCKHCQCDVGGTELAQGEFPICDKDDGQCRCRPGMVGRYALLQAAMLYHNVSQLKRLMT